MRAHSQQSTPAHTLRQCPQPHYTTSPHRKNVQQDRVIHQVRVLFTRTHRILLKSSPLSLFPFPDIHRPFLTQSSIPNRAFSSSENSLNLAFDGSTAPPTVLPAHLLQIFTSSLIAINSCPKCHGVTDSGLKTVSHVIHHHALCALCSPLLVS